jgi:hypothetical protein
MGDTQTGYCHLIQEHGEPYRIHKRGSPNDRSRYPRSGWAAPHEALIVRRGSDLRHGDQYCTDWPLARVLASPLPGAQRYGDEQPGRFLLNLMFAIATLAIPDEAGMGKAHAQTPFDGAWSLLITMDRGKCDPIDRLGVDIRDGALPYAGDSAVSIGGQVVGDGRLRVRLTNGNQSASGSGQLLASTGTWCGTGSASSCAGRCSAERRRVDRCAGDNGRILLRLAAASCAVAAEAPQRRQAAGQNPRKANGLQRCRNSDALFRGAGDMTGCSTSTSRDTSIASTAGGLKRIK